MKKRKERDEIVNDSNKVLLKALKVPLFNLPKDIWNCILSDAPNDEAIKIKRKLSMTCTFLHAFFQSNLDLNDAQRLLCHVLQGNAEAAKKIYDTNPRLLFIEVTAKEYAAGIDDNGNAVPRIQTESPIKAAARAGDVGMLEDMKKRLEKYYDHKSQKNGYKLAEEQLAEVFPEGFEYPPSTYDFTNLVETITHDPILIQATNYIKPGQASPRTEEILAKFRKDFIPDSENEKKGYHFNLNELIKAGEIFSSNIVRHRWNVYQANLFWVQVVGYLERLVSACDAQVLSQGIKNVLDGESLERNFNLYLNVNNEQKEISYFPLIVDSSCYLGGTFAVDNSCARSRGLDEVLCRGRWMRVLLKNYVKQKQVDLEKFKQQLHNSAHLVILSVPQ